MLLKVNKCSYLKSGLFFVTGLIAVQPIAGCKISSGSNAFESKSISGAYSSSPLTIETQIEQQDREFKVV
jgi:hypothetical protein